MDPNEPAVVLHGRFLLRREIGRGAYGAVYAAHDRELDHEVAVKVLQRGDAEGSYVLRREFRVLRKLRHPNLLRLYELFTEAPPHLISMELVVGRDLVAHQRQGALAAEALLPLLAQIADGLGWLHAAGFVHGDVKASNVLVGADGRVVLCDFGLTGRFVGRRSEGEEGVGGGGTVPYMAPELLDGGVSSPAADWYALGVVLYEALSGRRPFPGGWGAMVEAKRAGRVTPLRELGIGVPAELEALVAGLLEPDPGRRAREAAVRAVVGRPLDAGPRPRERTPFVGRAGELAALDAALAATREGRCAAVEVRGASGIGKTSLLDAFAETVAAGGGIVLRGACHVYEHVNFNAFDGIVDALSRHLLGHPEENWPMLDTLDTDGVLGLFPVLGRVLRGARQEGDFAAAERRRRGVEGLRALLGSLGRLRPTVLIVDDAQWADADSRALLRALLAPPDPPPVLVLLGVRSDPRSDGFGPEIVPVGPALEGTRWDTIELSPLDAEAARALAVHLVPGVAPGTIERLLAESGGVPFFVVDLARHVAELTGDGPFDLPGAVRRRVDALPRAERALLEVAAVAGFPLPRGVALDAAGLGDGGLPVAMGLETTSWLRVVGDPSAPRVDTYHDRLRAIVTDRLPEERRRELHLRIAEASLGRGVLDPEMLASQLQAAGESRRAAAYAASAARRALDGLAFEAAARFYGLAVELGHADVPAWSLRKEQAAALALAGRGGEAAAAYEAAARAAEDPLEVLGLQREGAEQWLRVGRVGVGLERLREVLGAVGLRWPRWGWSAVGGILWNRVRMRFWRDSGRRRAVVEIDPALLVRIDTAWSATVGLNMLDILRSAAFQARHTGLALATGEPTRMARALATEAAYTAVEGGASNRAFADRTFAVAHGVAEESGRADARAFVHLTEGAGHVFVGRFDRAEVALEAAQRLLRARNVGAVWEVVNCEMYRAWARWWRGDVGRLVETIPSLAADAQRRGDVMAEAALASCHGNLAWLVLDQPGEARARADHAVAAFATTDYGSPHYFDVVAQTEIDLYQGDGEVAWRRIRAAWPRFQAILFLRLAYFRVDLTVLRARAALAAGPVAAADARAQLQALAREDHAVAPVLAQALAATDAAGLRASLPALDRAGLGLFAAAARERLGEETGWSAQRVVAPARLAAAVLPGFSRGP